MKLVRDTIPDRSGTPESYHQVTDEEMRNVLAVELIAAAVGFIEAVTTPTAKEKLADALEIIGELAASIDYTMDELRAAQIAKRHEYGGYSERWVCDI